MAKKFIKLKRVTLTEHMAARLIELLESEIARPATNDDLLLWQVIVDQIHHAPLEMIPTSRGVNNEA